MNKKHFRLLVVFAAAILLIMVSLQVHWIRKTSQVYDQEFSQVAMISLQEVVQEMNTDKLNTIPSTVEQVASNLFITDLHGPVDTNLLASRMAAHFNTHSTKKISYALYQADNDRLLFGSNDLRFRKVVRNLSSNQNLKLLVYFPEKSLFLIGNVWVWYATLLLLLLLSSFLGYSVIVIYKQEKLTLFQKGFVNNMTHEFKTPLSTIGLSARTMLMHPSLRDVREMQKIASIIEAEALRLDDHVERILENSRIENSQASLRIEEVRIDKLLSNVVNTFEVEQQRIVIHENPDFVIQADRLHTQNLLANLIDNALKYSPIDQPIHIGTIKDGKDLILYVQDSGPGIPKEFRKKIFEPYFRVPKGSLHDVRGFGIGLNHASLIAKLHGWMLELKTKEGEGSRFSIRIKNVFVSVKYSSIMQHHEPYQTTYSLR